MARIQYQPTARSRGFRPQQLSTAGIDRMREESNRLIQGMERRRRAEKEQRDKDLQAMKEDAAYTEQITRENNAIELQNLTNESNQKIANIKGAAKQSQIDTEATLSIINSLADFSQTVGKIAAERTAQMVKDQTAKGLNADAQVISVEQVEQYKRGAEALLTGGIKLDTEIAVDGVLSNEDPYQTYKGYVSNHGFKGYAAQANDNKVAVQTYNHTLNKRLQDSEQRFTTAAGKKFSGVEALSDPELMAELQRQTRKDVSAFMGFTDPLYLSTANKAIDESDAVMQKAASKEGIKEFKAVMRQQADDMASTGTIEGVTGGFARIQRSEGTAAAHDWYRNTVIANPAIPIEVAKAPDFMGNGKTYDQQWSGPYNAAIQRRNEAIVKQSEFEERQKKAEEREWVNANIDSIQEAYNQNPQQAALLVKQRYHGKAMTVPPAIAAIEREAFKRNKDIMETTIMQRTKFGILDLSFVNSIQDPQLQKSARTAFEQQQEQRYGPEALGIKKGFKATARALTKINPNEEQGSAQTFLVQARLESEYLKQLKLTNDPLKALENVNKMVDAGNAGDKSSPFYIDPSLGDNNRPVFPNIESSDREVAEMNTYINKQLIKSGASVVDKPFALATANQMDATYTSSLSGSVKYPPGILQAADTLGLKPSELYNAHRMANNAATGDNKPLLTPSPATMLVDEAPLAMRRLFLSEEPAQIARAGAVTTGKPLPVRASMGGGNPSPMEAYEYMRSLGVSDTHAKGILANIKGESNFQTDVMGDNGMSGGLFQMYNDRYRAMEQAVPDWRTNWRGQIEHALQDDTAPQYLSMEFNSPEEAADWFLENYERPAMEHRPGRRELNRTFIPSLGF